MLDFLPRRSVLLAVLVASVASAKDREPQIRNVLLPWRPGRLARLVYVAGEVATVLHFEKDVDPAGTKLEGWEGRFEPLAVAGKVVVLVPILDLTPEDRLPLVVTLVDGTQIPFTVTADKATVDHQVNLFWDPETVKYLRADLENALKREQSYREENERYAQEANSPDHALAALLVTGSTEQTPFRLKQTLVFKDSAYLDSEAVATVYSGKGKVAVIVRIKNRGTRAWNLDEARLTPADGFWLPETKKLKCAVRMTPRSIAPGATGAVAIVADRSAFASASGLETLALQLIRDDGFVPVFVKLDPSLARE
ncbi:DUF2381 family protein [Stigmatella hybrida]|uniref:DUF2381 family protein n=1 Tax=Stigmatella hybrida TaxID=394097 RepID=UPI001CDA90C0|nr:DUF2381 family protein [Stigmatella hybrida]